MKKILNSVLAVSLVAGSVAIPASASAIYTQNDTTAMYATMESIGIMGSQSVAGVPLTRGGFCVMLEDLIYAGSTALGATYRSPFSDVPSNHWASDAIYRVYTLGYLNGLGNGNFAPDREITVGEGVTALLRVLGYSASDIGYMWPADYMAMAQQIGLLAGVSKGAMETMTYEDGATLLCTLLYQNTSSGKSYLSEISASTISDVILLDNDAVNGTQSNLLYIYNNGKFEYYGQDSVFGQSLLENSRGTLLINSNGRAMGFVPNDETVVKTGLTGVDATGIYNEQGGLVSLPAGTTLILGDSTTTFGMGYYNLEDYKSVNLFYGATGTIELVVASQLTGLAGVEITGYYENASPNLTQPETIQVLGYSFDVADSAVGQFPSLAIGDMVKLILNDDGSVARVQQETSSSDSHAMVGVLGRNSVTLTSGITLSGTVTTTAEEGQLVRVYPTGIGQFTAYAVSSTATSGLSGATNTLSGYTLSDEVVVYESVGTQSATEIQLEDLNGRDVDAKDVKYFRVADSGLVDVVLLENATGNLYTYGVLTSEEVTKKSNSMSYTNNEVYVTNSKGDSASYVVGTSTNYNKKMGGLVAGSDTRPESVVLLAESDTLARSAFDGVGSVVVDGVRYDISADVQVYNTVTETWTTLEEAKAFSDSFVVYYDRLPTAGGAIRVIYAY